MRSNFRITMVLFAGVAIGAIAVEGVHAQGAKLKAYVVSESDVLDAKAQAAFIPVIRKAMAETHHGRPLYTATGRIVPIEGGSPPASVGIGEWDSVDDAVAFYNSKAWTDFAPQRDKAQKTIRRYVVEVEN